MGWASLEMGKVEGRKRCASYVSQVTLPQLACSLPKGTFRWAILFTSGMALKLRRASGSTFEITD
jgi:hypothetical protein